MQDYFIDAEEFRKEYPELSHKFEETYRDDGTDIGFERYH